MSRTKTTADYPLALMALVIMNSRQFKDFSIIPHKTLKVFRLNTVLNLSRKPLGSILFCRYKTQLSNDLLRFGRKDPIQIVLHNSGGLTVGVHI